MSIKIVADSAADVLELQGIEFASAPLKILTDSKEYVDDAEIDVEQMVNDLLKYKGKSRTACPGPGDWVQAFGDAKEVICVTLTSGLSGSYNAACAAKAQYEEMFPERRVYVVDSLSAGPEMRLLVERLQMLIAGGKSFDYVCQKIAEYQKKVDLVFSLESLKNFANNGRVSHLVAKAVGILNIRLVGKASEQGTLEPVDKCRGEKCALSGIISLMKKQGYTGGKVRIAHCLNEMSAEKLKELIREEFQNAEIVLYKTRALCSFYAEKGGLLVGFEK